MKNMSIDLSYTLPKNHFFESRKAEYTFITFAKNTKFLVWLLKKYILSGGFKHSQRTSELVNKAYSNDYISTNKKWYEKRIESIVLRKDRNQVLVGNGMLLNSIYAQIRSKIFDQLHCQSILEVGSGRGHNIISLAALNPMRKLAGIELTQNGYERSLEWKRDLTQHDMELVGIGEDVKKIDFNKIQFVHGTGLSIPFPDKSFDASFTNLVLEQIPNDYPQVLKEMRRVTRKYCIFIEEFEESLSLVDKLYLKKRDYFRSSYKIFNKYGLRPVYFSTSFPRKMNFGTGLLIAQVL